LIIEESECRNQKGGHSARAKPKSKDGDEAMSVALVGTSGRGRRNGRGGRHGGNSNGQGRQRPPCWNCGSREHFKADCTQPATDKSADSKALVVKGSAHIVDDVDSEDDSIFAVDALTDPDSDLPDLLSLSDSDSDADERENLNISDADWFSEVGDDADLPCSDEITPELAAQVSDAHSDAPVVELYDSGSTRHISPYHNQFESLTTILPKSFAAANKQRFDVTGIGEMVIEVPNGVDVSKLRLTKALFSPEVGYTLVSIGRLDEQGYSVTFGDKICTIRDPTDDVVGHVPRSARGLYRVVHERDPDSMNSVMETITVMELHKRMGHISPSVARHLAESGLVSGIKVDLSSGEKVFCESCVYAKATRKLIAKEHAGECATEFGGEVHTDLWGPAPVETLGGRRYYISFTDDKTRLTYLHLLRQKSEAFTAYKDFEAWCQTQHNARIKTLHSNRGGEYLGKEFVMHLKAVGTKQKLTVHDMPQHNGIAEWLNRMLLEKVRAMLHDSGLPRALWGEAMWHAIWLKNRTPTKVLDGGTPYEAATGKKPDLSRARVWGSQVWVRVKGGTKLGGRIEEGRWVSIDDGSENGCRVYWPAKCSITVERNVYWDPSYAELLSCEGEEEENLPGVMLTPSEPQAVPPPPARIPAPPPVVIAPPPVVIAPPPEPEPPARRIRKPSQRLLDIMDASGTIPRGIQLPTTQEVPGHVNEQDADEEEAVECLLSIIDDPDDKLCGLDLAMAIGEATAESEALEPKTLAEARCHPDWAQWEEGIREELATLQAAGTWELADLPDGANLVGSKWVFRAKKDAAGHIVRHKARLVAQGFSQVPGIDFFNTYAPVATLASIRTVLALSARQDYELHQIDIKGAYLNGKLTEDEVIYMCQPPGFESPTHPQKVCCLRKTLYGLKQSGRHCWYQRLVEILVDELGFTQCAVDQAVFFRRREESSEHVIIVVHVDDCTIAAKSMKEAVELKTMIRKHVEITDLGELHWLLGIEVTCDQDKCVISLSQRTYIDSIIHRFNFDELKPVSNPMEPSTKLHSGQSPSTGAKFTAMHHIPYCEAIGSLMYASLGTCPDISYTVTTVSRFSSNPGMPHWDAVRRIYRYLLGTKDLKLTYGGVRSVLTGYADVDGSMAEGRKVISGYAFLIDGGAVSWSSKRQEIVSLSMTESEYVAATHAVKEALWLRSFIGELFAPLTDPITLFSDNQSAIALTKDHQYHTRTKHIDIRFHFIRWIIEEGKLHLIYCPTVDMVADTLTKVLPSPKVKHFAVELGLRST